MSVHAFDQRETLLGQGTLALELAGQGRRRARNGRALDTVLVPVGGGGLIGASPPSSPGPSGSSGSSRTARRP